MSKSEKLYITMQSITDCTGYTHPQKIILEDGRIYNIDRIKSFRPSNLYSPQPCDCYIITVEGQEKKLFYEPVDRRFGGRQGRWFLLSQQQKGGYS